jgi:hypothetical protein
MDSTTFFDGNAQHDGRNHSAYPLTYVDASTGTQELADISAGDSMQFALAFWAVSTVELDLFTELAVGARARR